MALRHVVSGLGARILTHNRRRFAAASAGMAVAVVIMFVEAGFFFGVLDSQANLATLVKGDLVAMHANQTNLNKWQELDPIRLNQIAALPGVAKVSPIYKGNVGLAQHSEDSSRRIVVYAFPPADALLAIGDPERLAAKLKLARTVLFDKRSRDIYGEVGVGREILLDRQPFRVAGEVEIGPNVISDGAVVMSEGNWLALQPSSDPILGVIRLKEGAPVEEARRAIEALAPGEITALTPGSLRNREFLFTIRAAPIGIIFGIGMLAGLVIGLITCYQILYNEISDQQAQYATLKAMGFARGFLARIILQQALLLSLVGFALALGMSYVAYEVIQDLTALIMRHTWWRTGAILVLTVVMSIFAGLLAMRRVARADPAELF